MILNQLIIAFFWTMVIDVFGFYDEIVGYIVHFLTRSDIRGKSSTIPRIKPFCCSTCLTWWTSLIYILIFHQFNLVNIAFCLICALSTNYILMIFNILDNIINKIYNFFMK